jgi:hypothetical protein
MSEAVKAAIGDKFKWREEPSVYEIKSVDGGLCTVEQRPPGKVWPDQHIATFGGPGWTRLPSPAPGPRVPVVGERWRWNEGWRQDWFTVLSQDPKTLMFHVVYDEPGREGGDRSFYSADEITRDAMPIIPAPAKAAEPARVENVATPGCETCRNYGGGRCNACWADLRKPRDAANRIVCPTCHEPPAVCSGHLEVRPVLQREVPANLPVIRPTMNLGLEQRPWDRRGR